MNGGCLKNAIHAIKRTNRQNAYRFMTFALSAAVGAGSAIFCAEIPSRSSVLCRLEPCERGAVLWAGPFDALFHSFVH